MWWTRDRKRTNHGIIRDASADGLFVELPGKDLDETIDQVQMECLLPDGAVSRVQGEVIWRGRKRGRHGVGIQIAQPDAAFTGFVEQAEASTSDADNDWPDKTIESSAPTTEPQDQRDYLVMMTGAHTGASYEILDSAVIGRHAECDIVLLDASASRRHSMIRRTSVGLLLEDLQSSNGTYLNGKKVNRAPLTNGDRIQIGTTTLKVFSEDDLEVRLRHAQKMESLGRLASGAAHDFNNILAVVTASASLISEMSEREDLRKLAKNILDASDNAAKISRQMLGISRRSEFKRQTFEARRLIKGLEAVFQQRTRGSHELELEVERNLWLLADYGQLEQVLLNVFNNAVDALGARDGTVRVHADSQELDMTSAATLGVRPGRYARISVTDSGSGMDEATLERVLEPYFTTKDEGEGTGLGLPMAQGIVEAHDGSLAIQSSVNEGTTVELWLPLTEPRTEVDNSVGLETAPLRTRGGNRLVLLVDNDESVRRAISEMLGFLGYRVVEAAGGAHALELARKTEFDIALLDVHLAFESGSEIARALKKLYPKLNVLMCS
ncbi:MAG: ATP-binding protein, partial [Myxococcota bacterium]